MEYANEKYNQIWLWEAVGEAAISMIKLNGKQNQFSERYRQLHIGTGTLLIKIFKLQFSYKTGRVLIRLVVLETVWDGSFWLL